MSNSISGNSTVLFGPEPNPSDIIGGYKLLKKLGQGGMGHVWKVEHLATGKLYAMKLLPPVLAADPRAWNETLKNFQLVSKLNHQHICPLHVLDRDPKHGPYLVMALIDGVSLDEYRDARGIFTPEEVATLLRPVAEALDYAHSQGVIHRDVKHDNIVLQTPDGGQTITGTFVIDFGLAAQVRSSISNYSQHDVPLAGTIRYMAPETWGGRPAVPQTDQYALAVIAYRLLAGHYPFDCPDRGIMREAVLSEEVEPISRATEGLNQVLLKGLSKNPNERFTTCEELPASLSRKSQLQAPTSSQTAVKYKSLSLNELQSLAQSGDSTAQFLLGNRMWKGEGCTKNSIQAFKLIRAAADSGHAEAQYTVGVMCMSGDGTLKNQKEALRWYRTAAENEWPEAQYLMYVHLEYADDDDLRREAYEWLQKAAANRHASAADQLASIYAGVGECDFIQQDEEAAVYWQKVAMDEYYVEATEKNDASAQFSLGFAYDSSFTPGVDEDSTEAAKWYALAAAQGHKRAMHKLAWCYCRGKGVAQDGQKALSLFKAAADMGDYDSENAIGLMYQSGYGVPSNLAKAAEWYRRAAAHGCSAAKHNLKNIGYD